MNSKNVLNNLQNRNVSLKNSLINEQLKHDNYSFGYFRKYSLLILNEYKRHNSLVKAALNIGMDPNVVMKWYVQGQRNNPPFRGFYLAVTEMGRDYEKMQMPDDVGSPGEIEEEYVISEYGDGWSYKTYVGGEKVFIISGDLETLRQKVKSRNLPLD